MYLSTLIIINLLIWGIILTVIVYVFILLIKALKKYLRAKPVQGKNRNNRVVRRYYNLLKKNEFRWIQLTGGKYRISKKSFEDWLDKQPE